MNRSQHLSCARISRSLCTLIDYSQVSFYTYAYLSLARLNADGIVDKADLVARVEQYVDALAAGTCPLRKAFFFSNFPFKKKNEKEFILFTMVENALDTLAAGACPLRKSFLIFLIIFF